MTKRTAAVSMLGTFVLGFLFAFWLIQRVERNELPRAVLTSMPRQLPRHEWQAISEETVELGAGETRKFTLTNSRITRFRFDSSMPISVTLESSRESCASVSAVTGQEECNIDGAGTFALVDNRTPQTSAIKGLLGVYTRSSKLIESAMMPARVHFVLSEYRCTENCPAAER